MNAMTAAAPTHRFVMPTTRPLSSWRMRYFSAIASLLIALLLAPTRAGVVPAGDRMFITKVDRSGVYEYNSSGAQIGSSLIDGVGMVAIDAKGRLYANIYSSPNGQGVVRITPSNPLNPTDPKLTVDPDPSSGLVAIGQSQNLYIIASGFPPKPPLRIRYLEDNALIISTLMPVPIRYSAPAVDADGNVYVINEAQSSIRKIAPNGTVTVAHNGTGIAAVACGPDGELYYSDSLNIRRVASVAVAPVIASAPSGITRSMAIDSTGTLFVCAFSGPGNDKIYKYVSNNATVFASVGAESIVFAKPADPNLTAMKNDAAAGISGAKFSSFGFPAVNASGRTAFAAKVVGMTPAVGINASNYFGIWADNSSGTRQLVVRSGSTAPGAGSAVFKSFNDPVYNGNHAVAFRATLLNGTGGVVTANNTGIWSNRGGTLHLVARAGSQAAGCPTGATFKSFTQLALPDQGGVVFIGNLNTGAGSVTSMNNMGIWAVDTSGVLQLIVRKGATKTVKGLPRTINALSFLPAATPVTGQTRNFDQATGDLAYRAGFSDGNTGIFHVVFP